MRSLCFVLSLCAPLLGVPSVHAEEAPSEETVAAWVRTLSTYGGADAARETARKGIAGLAPASRAQSIARSLLSDLSAVARVEGAQTAALMRKGAEALLPDLFENLRDQDATVREASLRAIGLLGSQRLPRPLSTGQRQRVMRLLNDPATSVRGAALEALARLRALDNDEVVERLLDRAWSSKALPALFERGDAATHTVQALLSAPSWHVRQETLRMLRFHARPRAKVRIAPSWVALVGERAHNDPSTAVRVVAVNLLGAFGQSGLDVTRPLLRAMSETRASVRATAFRAVQSLALAGQEPVARLLVQRLGAIDVHERVAAAWILRHAARDATYVDEALRARLEDDEPTVVASAAAALLERDRQDPALIPHLVAFVASTGVPWPFPRPQLTDWGRDLGTGGGRLLYGGGFPGFAAYPTWCAEALVRMGPVMVAPLVAALAESESKGRTRWIHALGHVGVAGRAALSSQAASLSDAEAFELDVMRVHAGEKAPILITRMMQVVTAGPDGGTVPVEVFESDPERRNAALALDALVIAAPGSIDPLVAAMEEAKASGKGHLPGWLEQFERVLRAIGKPALPAVERAARGSENGSYFTDLLEALKRL